MPLTTYYSNRLEVLAAELAALVSKPLHSPFDEEIIIVQSNGMARWLSMYLAQRLGVSANLRFSFPSGFLWEILRKLLSDIPETSAYERPILTWRVMELLQKRNHSQSPAFAPLRAYLKNADELRYFELARRIADSYDQYLVYRPDWIEDWEKQSQEHWQAALWRQLVKRDKEPHRVKLQNRFFQELSTVSAALSGLPERVSLLGISALPPVQLQLLAQLSEAIEVHLFLLNPCEEYWGDIVADRDIARRSAEIDPSHQYLEVGNPLLASLGKQGRDFIDLIQQYPVTTFEHYQAPAEVSLLGCLQADILHLHRRGEENSPKTPIAEDDDSLQIHACHSPMREIEVLHDQLLALFEADPALTPSDIVVMTPDIEAYSPAIEAVFDTIQGERRIPFSIADRSPLYENPQINAFLQLLELPNSRYPVNYLLELLELPAIRQCFQLSEDNLSLIQHWLQDTGIRWGIDSADRAALELPAMHEHSWRAGLERLLLGYALPGNGHELYQTLLPYNDAEGSAAEVMGKLQHFAETTFRLRSLNTENRLITEWSQILHRLIEDFFAPADSEQEQLQPIRSALEKLDSNSQHAVYNRPISLAVMKAALQLELTESTGFGGFFSGGVTFCTLVPMRSIPFKIICLIGMNNDTYPRPHRPPDFDLMLQDIRKGDRSRRQDDRYLFLEALISARDCLYISYVGSNIRDNSVIPPSVLVSELVDVIDQGFCSASGAAAQDQVVRYHPLQGFSRRYFANNEQTGPSGCRRFFSYSEELAELSRHSIQTRSESSYFFNGELPEADAQWRQLDLEQLIRFFQHPVRFLLRERLNVQLRTDLAPLPDHEPFVLDGLANYQLREQLLNLQLNQQTAQQAKLITGGSGVLPHGEVGATLFAREWESVERFTGRLRRFLPEGGLSESLAVDFTLGDIRVFGQLPPLSKQGLFAYRLASVNASDYLKLWLQHLLLNITAPKGIEPVSHWLGQDKELVLEPVARPEQHLQILLKLYWQGLHQLLAFFPKTALAYIEATLNKNARTNPEDKALQTWEGNERVPGEADDVYYQLAFRGQNPIDQTFISLSETIVRPIFVHLQNAD